MTDHQTRISTTAAVRQDRRESWQALGRATPRTPRRTRRLVAARTASLNSPAVVDVSDTYTVTDPAADGCREKDKPPSSRVTSAGDKRGRSDSVGILPHDLWTPDSRQRTDSHQPTAHINGIRGEPMQVRL